MPPGWPTRSAEAARMVAWSAPFRRAWSRSGRAGGLAGGGGVRFQAWPVFAILVLVACSPALDWRDVRAEGRDLLALLPCKPAAHARQVLLGPDRVTLTLQACQAADMTWGLASADVAEPARVGSALQALRAAATANLGTPTGQALPLQVPGATPQPDSGRTGFVGLRPDGQPMQSQVAVFARGTVVYQATVLGERVPADAAQTFFESFRWTR
jgi:hypothetical protein